MDGSKHIYREWNFRFGVGRTTNRGMSGRAEIWKGDDLVCVLVSTAAFLDLAQMNDHLKLRCIRWAEEWALTAGRQTR